MIIAFILQGLAIDESVSRVIAFPQEKGCKKWRLVYRTLLQRDRNT